LRTNVIGLPVGSTNCAALRGGLIAIVLLAAASGARGAAVDATEGGVFSELDPDLFLPVAYQQPGSLGRINLPGASSGASGVGRSGRVAARPASLGSGQSQGAQLAARTATPTSFDVADNRNNMFGDAPLLQLIRVTATTFTGTTTNVQSTTIPGSGSTVGRIKIAENTSPLPQDRIFFGYSHYTDVPFGTDPTGAAYSGSLDRFVPGFEKMFFEETMSIDVRMPFAATQSNDVGGIRDEIVLGNMTATLKGLLLERERMALSAGIQFDLPTSPNTRFNNNLNTAGQVEQDGVRYMPFLGSVWRPTNRLYVQSFAQFDVAGAGTTVRAGNNVVKLDNWNLFYSDVSFGYWVVLPEDNRLIDGLAPIIEIHYNQTVGGRQLQAAVPYNPNPPPVPPISAQVINDDIENLNLTLGMHLRMRSNTMVSAAYILPVFGGQVDAQMDGEFRLMINQFLGGSAR
jgi:hypothetical protein